MRHIPWIDDLRRKVLVYGIAKGKLEHVFSGDEPGRHTGELLGHSGVITALFFYKHTVYTGSMDCTVQVDKRVGMSGEAR